MPLSKSDVNAAQSLREALAREGLRGVAACEHYALLVPSAGVRFTGSRASEGLADFAGIFGAGMVTGHGLALGLGSKLPIILSKSNDWGEWRMAFSIL